MDARTWTDAGAFLERLEAAQEDEWERFTPIESESFCTANRHGTLSAYVQGCRCPEARRVHADWNREWRRKKKAQRG